MDHLPWLITGSFAVFLTLLHTLVVLGLLRSRHHEKAARDPERWPSISIVIPAKDEESNLPALFATLKTLDYPDYDIVFINDRSTDRTGPMMEEFRQSWHADRVTILTLTENPGPNFKQQGLKAGTKLAKGEILALTDADCSLDPQWLRRLARHFNHPRVGLVLGPVFKEQKDNSFFMNFQAFDHIFRYAYAAGSAGIGLSGGGFGNNIAVRRTALDAIGGYDGVPYSVTEDAALISTIHSKTKFKVRAQTFAQTGVVTAPMENWRRLIKQEVRWNNGGIYSPDPATRIPYTVLMLAICATLAVLPALPWALWLLPLPAALALSVGQVALVSGFLFGRKLRHYWLWIAPTLFFLPWFYAWLTILSLLRVKVVWKDNTMKAH